jgi:hypothetical protein
MNYTEYQFQCNQNVLTSSIKVNQVGYLPERKKLAYVGDYLGDSSGGVWAVGASGSIWHWSRITNNFEKMKNVPTEVSLRGVVAQSSFDVWAVGDSGIILHYDGNGWTLVPSPTTADLYAIEFSPDR